jgi:Tol biopolymer transport system component
MVVERKDILLGIRLVTAAAVLSSTSSTQTTTRASVGPGGIQGNSYSYGYVRSISPDGRSLVFSSYASNLVPVDTNGMAGDVFVRDLVTGVNTLVSLSSAGTQGNGGAGSPSRSFDGRYVAFVSDSTDLVPGDTNGHLDVFVRDLQAGTTIRASVDSSGAQGNDDSSLFSVPSISADGRYLAFDSLATNLVPGDTNVQPDVFVRDLQAGTTTRVSVDSSGGQADDYSLQPSISADGRYVAFWSGATNLVPGDTNGQPDVFVKDLQTGATIRVSSDSSGTQGNGISLVPSISADGRYVAFVSDATNLVVGDGNGAADVFLRDLLTGTTTLVSVDSSGAQSNGASASPTISAAGRFVAFTSAATNLVQGDTNGWEDAFLHDNLLGNTVRVSVDSAGAQGNGLSRSPSMSADGRFVAFQSAASNLVAGDTNGWDDVFLRDRGDASAFVPFCFGDGTGAGCPCGNSGLLHHGCENSAGTGGARLVATGIARLSGDTVFFDSSGELPSALSIFLQGTLTVAPVDFGDGLRCTGGVLKRLYVKNASGGTASAPQGGDPSVSARSSTLGDQLPLGCTRIYQVYYRDSNPNFCPGPSGSTFNVSNAVALAWGA